MEKKDSKKKEPKKKEQKKKETKKKEPTDIAVDADREMAFVAKIKAIEPIKDADKIELATVLGWRVIVIKNDFKVGDLCIYYTLMSIPDGENPYFDFLKDKNGVMKPLKSKKIRGVLSQGLITKLDIVKHYGKDPATLKEGEDVTELMKVKKLVEKEEAEVYTSTENEKAFPEYLPKTDEERIQKIPNVLNEIVGMDVIITRKEDGTSGTYALKDGVFLICSRNKVRNTEESKSDDYIKAEKLFNIEKGMRAYGKEIGIQGEIVGPGINKNRLELKKMDFRVFNIFWIEKQMYATYDECEEICKALNLHMVPLLYRGKFKEEWNTVDNIMKYAESIEYYKGGCAEGIVVKNDVPEKRISFKVVSNKYLLKHNA